MFSLLAILSKPELERIYELTYKYQMLKQEESLGDYGLPQLLPDRAQMELLKIEDRLDGELNDALSVMYGVFDRWIDEHRSLLWMYAEIYAKQDAGEDTWDTLDEDTKVGLIYKYIDSMLSRREQMTGDPRSWGELRDVEEMLDELQHIENKGMSNKIITFQKALTTVHFGGSMADTLLGVQDGEGTEILDGISSGPYVNVWDSELSKLLGYEVGTRSLSKQEWFSPILGLAKVIAILGRFVKNVV